MSKQAAVSRAPKARAWTFAVAVVVACGGSQPPNPDGGLDGASDGAIQGDGPDGSVVPPSATCTSPLQPVDTSTPSTVVGTGSASSCTEQALDAAIQKGGIITFDCGGAATIAITAQHDLRTDVDTTIDGGGKVTLDGGGSTRILHFVHADYRKNTTKVTLQHLTMRGGKATGTAIPAAPPPCSQGTDTDGGGGAIWMRDGVLHVYDVTFQQNQGAPLGPDVAGGAVYALGSLEVIVAQSAFSSNQASNGGAIGMLNSDVSVYNTTFTDNQAIGTGGNDIDKTKCPSTASGEIGSGGSGGAIVVDGGDGTTITVCGVLLQNNKCNVLGGAMFRTPDNAQQKTSFDRCTIDGNTSAQGGGALYMHNSVLQILSTTMSNNAAQGAGGIQADGTTIDFQNSTFYANHAIKGLGGAMSLFGGTGTIKNCTFAQNLSDGGSGLFAAAIAGGPTLQIDDSVFDTNTSQDCGAPMTCQVGSGSGQADVQWPQDHIVCSGADPACAPGTTFADPKLGAFGDNGGPTKTLLPLSGSPAIGIGKACLPFDQRGQARKTPDGCTAGAVEAP